MQTHVEVDQTWSQDCVPTGISMAPRRDIDIEGGKIEPLIGSFRAGVLILSAYYVRAQRVCVAIFAEARIVDTKWSEPVAGLCRQDAIHLPTTDYGVRDGGQVGGEMTGSAERQIVDGAVHKALANIEIRVSIFPVFVAGIAERVTRVGATEIRV